MRLANKVAIVTGGGSGFGEGIVSRFAEEGCAVIVADIDEAAARRAADAAAKSGGKAAAVKVDVASAADTAKMVGEAVAKFGRLDIMVNNAGVTHRNGPLTGVDEATFDRIFDVNVKGPFELCKTAHSVMVERGGGAIVNVSSIGGITPEAGLGLYSMSKSALISLTKVMAQEWGADGIRANAICPGLIRTKFSAALWQDGDIADKVLGHQPIRRIGVPDDVAGLTLFLASDASAYCTGSVYMVDGGYLS
jgi:NAD(P)-dependent dehydrogenase (short-subunit alcohol dehydrogenase family)